MDRGVYYGRDKVIKVDYEPSWMKYQEELEGAGVVEKIISTWR